MFSFVNFVPVKSLKATRVFVDTVGGIHGVFCFFIIGQIITRAQTNVNLGKIQNPNICEDCRTLAEM